MDDGAPLFGRVRSDALLRNGRSELRYYCRIKCYYTSVDDEKGELEGGETWLLGKTVNLSQRGIAVVTQRPYDVATVVAVTPLLPGWDQERQLLARITNVRREAQIGWRLGCEFVNDLTEAEVLSQRKSSTSACLKGSDLPSRNNILLFL
jgi:hypothetical protein